MAIVGPGREAVGAYCGARGGRSLCLTKVCAPQHQHAEEHVAKSTV